MSLVVHQDGLASRWSVDTILLRIDGRPPLKLAAKTVSADVTCSRYATCRWNATAYAKPTKAEWDQMTAGSTLLVALGSGHAVLDPLSVEPSAVRAWLESLAAEGLRP